MVVTLFTLPFAFDFEFHYAITTYDCTFKYIIELENILCNDVYVITDTIS